MKKNRPIDAIDAQLKLKVLPELEIWGLKRHTNSLASFGKIEFGYWYDFADSRDFSDIRLARIVIFSKDNSIVIQALRMPRKDNETPIFHGDEKGLYTLSRRASLRHLLNRAFALKIKKDETVEVAAAHLIDDVIAELPRLKRYLYG